MSGLYQLEVNVLEQTKISLLPKDVTIQLEQKDKIGFDIGRDIGNFKNKG
jgi:hypothetical protein